jgi:hypothetical protein
VIVPVLWSALPLLGEPLLPLVKAEIRWLDNTLRVDGLYFARETGEPIVRLEVALARPITIDGRTYVPDPRGKATSSTLVGYIVLPAALFLASLFAIPAVHWQCRLIKLAAAIPGAMLICAIETPIILLAGIWRWVLAAVHSEQYPYLLMWDDFLQQGGGNVLAICSGLALAYMTDQYCREQAGDQRLRRTARR